MKRPTVTVHVGDTPTVVLTSRQLASTRESVEFHSGDLERLVAENLAPRFGNVWVVGGAMLCQGFLERGLVDEIQLMIAPILLGDVVKWGCHWLRPSRPNGSESQLRARPAKPDWRGRCACNDRDKSEPSAAGSG